MITKTNTNRGILESWDEGTQLSIVYIVESSKTDTEFNLEFSNVESMPCETLQHAIYISQEWQKAQWNNISVTMQVKKGDQILIEDKAYETEYIPRYHGKYERENRQLNKELNLYKDFVHEYKSEKLFESFQNTL